MAHTVAVDTGGTFTDIVWQEGGRLFCRKVPSTPRRPYRAVLEGVEGLAARRLLVGTTVATNALIEMRELPPALITTAGFEDILEIARQNRLNIYDLHATKPPAPIPGHLRMGVAERIRADGSITIPLDTAALKKTAKKLIRRRNRRVAVCFLHSTTNPRHELLAEKVLKEMGFLVRLSHRILPLPREYERFLTCALSVYAEAPLERFMRGLGSGFGGGIFVMANFGGYIEPERALERAIETVMSGPAGGVVAAAALANRLNLGDVISLDMGGTSCDVCAITSHLPVERGLHIGPWVLPLRSVAVLTIGAGGGSVIWLDAGGALRVGPRSAGAHPGPAAYQKGGPPTLTDADLILGRLPVRLPSGLELSRDASQAALKKIASQLSTTVEDVARGAVSVADVAMAEAVRGVTVRRGLDPRRFTLVAFGGAGPLHAAAIAEILSIPRVVVPPEPGVFSAYGLLAAKRVHEEAIPLLAPVDEGSAEQIAAAARKLRHRFTTKKPRIFAEMRYVGQEHELTVPFASEPRVLRRRFNTAHRARYGWCSDEGVEVVALVGRAVFGRGGGGRFRVFDEPVEGGMSRGEVLREGAVFGPAVVCDMSATTYVPSGWVARAGPEGALILERHK